MTIEIIEHVTETIGSFTQIKDPVQRGAADIGRQEVTVEGALAAIGEVCDYIYLYLPGMAELDLDPWRLVDGLDRYVTDPDKMDIWLASGNCKTVSIKDCPYRFFIGQRFLSTPEAA